MARSFSSRGQYLVTDQVAPCFVLRNGEAVTMSYNDTYAAPALDAASPQPRRARRRGFLGLFGGAGRISVKIDERTGVDPRRALSRNDLAPAMIWSSTGRR